MKRREQDRISPEDLRTGPIDTGSRTKERSESSRNRAPNLQQAVGNQAMLRLLQSGDVHAKLDVSQPGDPDEMEANRMAEQVVSPTVHRKCSCEGSAEICPACRQKEAEKSKGIHRETNQASTAGESDSEDFLEAIGPGQPLEPQLRADMESRFGHDFGVVKVHTGEAAASSARSVNARAFTAGQRIVFGEGEYAPHSNSGVRLLTHELAHTVQNRNAAGNGTTISHGTRIQRESLLGKASDWFGQKTGEAGKWLDQKKWEIYRAMIASMKAQKTAGIAMARAFVPKLPNSLQSAAFTIIDVVDSVVDLEIALILAIIGLAVGFVEGIVGLVVGLIKLVIGFFKMFIDWILSLLGRGEAYQQDVRDLAAAIAGIPSGLRKLKDQWLDRYQHASLEEQVLMGGELVGQIEAFLATFAFAGTKAGQATSFTVRTGEVAVKAGAGGVRVLEPAVATVTIPAVIPKTVAQVGVATTQMMMMSASGSGSGSTGSGSGKSAGQSQAPPSEKEPTPETPQKVPAEGPPEKTAPSSTTKAPQEPVEGKPLTAESGQLRKPGEGIPVDAAWGNPKSVKAYGHSLLEHGPKRPAQELIDRAVGKSTPQGQWLDENFIVEAEQRAPLKEGENIVDMGKPVGKVYMPDGSVVENVSKVKVIRRADMTVNTSYPFSGGTQ